MRLKLIRVTREITFNLRSPFTIGKEKNVRIWRLRKLIDDARVSYSFRDIKQLKKHYVQSLTSSLSCVMQEERKKESERARDVAMESM